MAKHPNDNPDTYPFIGRKLVWLDKKKNVDRVVYALYTLCALLFSADFFYHKHTEVGIEEVPGFYAIYGFVMCAALVISARGLRVILMRREDYYAPMDVQAEDFPEDQLERIDHDA